MVGDQRYKRSKRYKQQVGKKAQKAASEPVTGQDYPLDFPPHYIRFPESENSFWCVQIPPAQKEAFFKLSSTLTYKEALQQLKRNSRYSASEAAKKKAQAKELKLTLIALWDPTFPLIKQALTRDPEVCSGPEHAYCEAFNEKLQINASCSFINETLKNDTIKYFIETYAKYLAITDHSRAWMFAESLFTQFIYIVCREALDSKLDLHNSRTWLQILFDIKYLGRGTERRPFMHFREAVKLAEMERQPAMPAETSGETVEASNDLVPSREPDEAPLMNSKGPASAAVQKTGPSLIVKYLKAKYIKLSEEPNDEQVLSAPRVARFSSSYGRFVAITEATMIDSLGVKAKFDIANRKKEDGFTAVDREELPFMGEGETWIKDLLTVSAISDLITNGFEEMTPENLKTMPTRWENDKRLVKITAILELFKAAPGKPLSLPEVILGLLSRVPSPNYLHSKFMLDSFGVSSFNRFLT